MSQQKEVSAIEQVDALLVQVSKGSLGFAGLVDALADMVAAERAQPAPTTAAKPGVTSAVVSTDGACSGNPGPAGWAWVRHNDGIYRRGNLGHSTNQAAELMALLDALREHAEVPDLEIRSDSAYAIGTYTQWMDGAAGRGWVSSQGRPTSNRDIIEQLILARDARREAGLPPARLVKVKGHSADAGNNAADAQAVAAKNDKQLVIVDGQLRPEEAAVLRVG